MADKDINTSAFNELITTSKRSDIRVVYRDTWPRKILNCVTKINGVVTHYTNPADHAAYAKIEKGELIVKAPPNLGDITIVYTRRHSVFHPDNGKRISTSLFNDTFLTGESEFGLANMDDTTLELHDAITIRSYLGQYSGRIFSEGLEKTWPEGASNIINQTVLDEFRLDPLKGHLVDIQAQLRNVANVYYFLSSKAHEGPKEALQYYGLNNQDNVTTSNPALHGVYICRNNGVQSQIRSGCLNIANETDDEDLQTTAIFSNTNDITCEQTGTVMTVVRCPYVYGGQLNTQDAQYYDANIFADKRAKVKIFRVPDESLLTKTVGGLPVPLEDSDWTQHEDTSLQYIDNSIDLPSQLGVRITGFNMTGLNPIRQKGFAAASEVDLPAPDVRKVPIFLVHGEALVVVGFGKTAAAAMSVDSLDMGVSV